MSVFIIAVTTLSILDVLHSYLDESHTPPNYLNSFTWKPRLIVNDSDGYARSPEAKLPFGYYATAKSEASVFAIRPRVIWDGSESYESKSCGSAFDERTDPHSYSLETFSQIFALSINQESAVTGSAFTHKTYTLESITGPTGVPKKKTQEGQSAWEDFEPLGVGLGITAIEHANGLSGRGTPVRLIFGYREYPEFLLSYTWRHSWLNFNNQHGQRNGHFVRFEVANGPLSFYLGLGYDYVPADTAGNDLQKKTVVFGGFQLIFYPWSFRTH